MLPQFINPSFQENSNIEKSAVCIDIRERNFLEEFLQIFNNIKEKKINIEMLFLEAKNDVLIRRFSETKRPHPLAPKGEIIKGILLERERLTPLRDSANLIIDTSTLNVHELKALIQEHYAKDDIRTKKLFNITVVSFGFKYGTPENLDLMFDVRFLINPYFVNNLKPLSGDDPEVMDYIFSNKNSKKFLKILFDFFRFTIPQYENEGRAYLTIGIGCTGGKHRSVAITNKLAEFFKEKKINTTLTHRDKDKS